MVFEEAGTYTIEYTATDECGNTTNAERTVIVEEPPIYGVLWNKSDSSPQLTRTRASANFSNPSPAINNGNGSSPFDDIMPWSGMEIVEDANVGTLVSIPKFYYKWIWGSEVFDPLELQISPQPQEGFFVSPAHADRGDGVGERDVVYVGRYHCVDTTFKSTSGSVPLREQPRSYFRTNIHSLGADIWQYDYAMYWTIAMLYLVEYATFDSQSAIGYGCSENNSVQNNGLTDNMLYHTGTNAASKDTYGQIQYRHIEGLWSNVLDWCDGLYRVVSGSKLYAIKNPADFNDTSNGVLIGSPASSGCISSPGTPPEGFEYALYPGSSTEQNVFDIYWCDGTDVYNAHGQTVAVGGSYEQNQKFGIFNIKITTGSTSYASDPETGSRLMKLPSA